MHFYTFIGDVDVQKYIPTYKKYDVGFFEK